MFSPAWLDLIVLILIVGLLLRSHVLVTLGLLLILTVAFSWMWNRYVLRGVTFERKFSSQKLFPGDEVEMEISVANRKLLPLAWLRWEDRFPTQVQLLRGRLHPGSATGSYVLSRGTTVRWYQRVRWRYPLRLGARGLFAFGPTTLRSGDVFGLFEKEVVLEKRDRILVYPKLLSLAELGIPARFLLGETRAPRQLFTDPVRTVGVRDYQPGDSFRFIHWPASARRQQLQVKVHEPVATLQMAIFLDLDTFAHYWEGLQTEICEHSISVAASVAKAALETQYAVGLYVNGVAAESDQPVRLPPSRHPGQLESILESLAKLVPFSTGRMSRLLPAQVPRLALGTSLVLISSLAQPDLLPVLLRLSRRGRRIVLLYPGDDPPSIRGVQIHPLGLPSAYEPDATSPTRIRERPPVLR
jgi:uncharacterized protein (DUF58 family)